MRDALTRPWARRGRILTLLVAPWLAIMAGALSAHGGVLRAVLPVLAVLWIVMVGALNRTALHRAPGEPRTLDWAHVDLLTATGAAALWTATGALALAALTGWASLALLGVLGVGAVQLVVAWTASVAGGDRPWRHAIVRRTISPEICVEGDALREDIRLSGVRIPTGMRLFITGWTTWHGAATRYAIGAEAGRAEVKLVSELGPARRGEHRAPLLQLWLGDTLGLTRTAIAYRGSADFMVLPRPGTVHGARGLLASGGPDDRTQPTWRQPTEGTFRMREYVPGDDARRIHWVRSLQVDKLIMRLPDEIPPAEPALRLVLDNELNPAYDYLCEAPGQLLDAMVRVWLGVANALTASGTRVTLVTAASLAAHDEHPVTIERVVHARAPREVLRLGARIAWQNQITLASLLARNPARHVVVSSRPRPLAATSAGAPPMWVIVPEATWTEPDTWLPRELPVVLAYPAGAADNRFSRRRRDRDRHTLAQRDRQMFSQALHQTGWQFTAGHYIASPKPGRIDLTETR